MKQLHFVPYLLLAVPAVSGAAGPVRVGGMAPVTLHRKATSHGHEREFTSITLLPGRGLNTFQITANLPGRGEPELLRSPSLQSAAERMNERGDDAFGNLNHAFGGAFLIPFTSRAGGELSEDKKLVVVHWHGREIRLPNDYLGHYAVHGLINTLKAQDIHIRKTPAGTIEAWLSDPKADYAIRVRGFSPEIRTLHLWSAKDDSFCAIEEQHNFMDPFGPQWQEMHTGLVTLKPGAST